MPTGNIRAPLDPDFLQFAVNTTTRSKIPIMPYNALFDPSATKHYHKTQDGNHHSYTFKFVVVVGGQGKAANESKTTQYWHGRKNAANAHKHWLGGVVVRNQLDSPAGILFFVLELPHPAHPWRRLRTAANFRIEYDCGDNNAKEQNPEANYEYKYDVHRFVISKVNF